METKNTNANHKILVIDNYDSFVYNLVHYLEDLNCLVTVKRNREFTLEEVKNYDKILLSPGPGLPSEAGKLNQLIQTYAGKKSILGVCLGQQAIGEVFGAKLQNLAEVYHGVASTISLQNPNDDLFKNLPSKLEVGRYHSWVITNLPAHLIALAYDEKQQIMAIKHRDFSLYGVQFHPESVLTPQGKSILQNWLAT
ncbi:anthranilate synthase component II [Haloflavibacter putidus]|uniref:Aminodeoxychorismate/anthranilate synthase component II n=1 Tax=Haloflavibacter putidus TaxID=2576776 RepID=A0A507ZQN8_9FLAO|nr:aminodeoxychorismate/anthranilate synthase component II [Haloflavibacter putidus]TQD38843.1 aminodeoxychorismate/anthranilate synthase component II [Haloflavibacter putidus]